MISQALGGKKTEGDAGDKGDVQVIESWDQLVAAMSTVGGRVG